MFWMKSLEHLAVTLQCWNVNIVHRVVFQEHSIVASFIGITEHHLQFLLRAMIVAFMVTLERTLC